MCPAESQVSGGGGGGARGLALTSVRPPSAAVAAPREPGAVAGVGLSSPAGASFGAYHPPPPAYPSGGGAMPAVDCLLLLLLRRRCRQDQQSLCAQGPHRWCHSFTRFTCQLCPLAQAARSPASGHRSPRTGVASIHPAPPRQAVLSRRRTAAKATARCEEIASDTAQPAVVCRIHK
jgi:hypothetical protein